MQLHLCVSHEIIWLLKVKNTWVKSVYYITGYIVTDDPGSKQDQRYPWWIDMQNYSQKN